MKKVIIFVLIALVAGASVFAMDFHLGVMQNFLDTSVIADLEFDHFGVEGSLGTPIILGVSSLIDAVASGEDVEAGDGISMLLMPGVMVNGYWKVIDAKHFGLRLGLQADVIGLFTDNLRSVIGLWGPSIGFNFKFNDKFSMNLTGTIPAALPLSLISEDATSFGAFGYVEGGEDLGDFFAVFFGQLLPGVLSEFARLSFKWKI